MEIKVLGTGCPKCKALHKAVSKAVSELGLEAEISKVEDITDIMSYGVMITPAIVINGKVVSSGKVPPINELQNLITTNK